MSHTVHPYSHRLIVQRDWKSRWFADKEKFRVQLRADVILREFLEKRLKKHFVASVEFESGRDNGKVFIHTSRPGMIIGRNGEGSEKLKKDLFKYAKKKKITLPQKFEIEIVEVKNPDSNAMLVAQNIAEGLEKRLVFRRVMKMALDKIMASNEVKGARIVLAGRLGGNEMARKEEVKRGGIPLQFIRGDIDYASYKAILYYGVIGVKVWIYKGDSLENKK